MLRVISQFVKLFWFFTSTSKYVQLHYFILEPDVPVPSAVNNLAFMPNAKVVVITVASGRIWLYKAQELLKDEDISPVNDEMANSSLMELGSNGLKIHCTTIIQSLDTK